MTAPSLFVDTNVLVYSVDRSEPERKMLADAVLGDLVTSRSGAISPQVVAEFVSAGCNRLRSPLTKEQVESVIVRLLPAFTLIPIDAAVVREALRCWRRYSISYWDAQIWATARIGGIDTIVTEDCPMAELEGVRYINPFAEGFSLADLNAS